MSARRLEQVHQLGVGHEGSAAYPGALAASKPHTQRANTRTHPYAPYVPYVPYVHCAMVPSTLRCFCARETECGDALFTRVLLNCVCTSGYADVHCIKQKLVCAILIRPSSKGVRTAALAELVDIFPTLVEVGAQNMLTVILRPFDQGSSCVSASAHPAIPRCFWTCQDMHAMLNF